MPEEIKAHITGVVFQITAAAGAPGGGGRPGPGAAGAGREVGAQFSFPTVRRMLAHIYGADWVWLTRWKGSSPTTLPGGGIDSLAALRERWDRLGQERQARHNAPTPADLDRIVDYKNVQGQPFRLALGPLLQHVANHATPHRSEVATRLTMISGPPPPPPPLPPAGGGRGPPADGVVTGFGKINGRLASVIAYDFTVMAGSMGRTAEVKCNRAREIALTKRMPMVWLIDSAGARIQEAIGPPLPPRGPPLPPG